MAELRHDWRIEEVRALFELPFNDLVFQAQSIHREHFDANEVQLSTLLNIKSGACPEDCAYCPQSVRHNTGMDVEPLMQVDDVRSAAERAKAAGATRFCMGAAWRSPKDRDIVAVAKMIKAVRELGMETCMTLGMLTDEQAAQLRDAGLDYYNHNVDTSPEYYEKIITTRTYQDRLDTLESVRNAGMKVCCGGIVGMGEQETDRAEMLRTLANLPQQPESVPINQLVKVSGTPLDKADDISSFDFIRTIAVARIMMPKSMVRLSAGRSSMAPAVQSLCFLAGANSIFYGDKLLTTGNPDHEADQALLDELGMRPMAVECAALGEVHDSVAA
ncbi:MAG: biotin synthase BioB [Oceanococcus sp.]